MRFDLDPQQREFQQAVVDFLKEECPLQRAMAPHDNGQIDHGVWKGLMDLGVGAIVVPEDHGGLGLGLLDLAIVAEAVGRFAAPGAFIEHALVTWAIANGASEEQKAQWLPGLATGDLRGTVALSEGKGLWNASSWRMPAAERLNGTKQFVLNTEEADLILVGLEGGRLGVVEKGAAGIASKVLPCTDAGKQTAHLTFSDTPCQLLPGNVGERLVTAGLILLAADSFGGASHCVNITVEYAKLREQYGQLIGAFQALKHQLADMAIVVEPNIGLYWYAAHAFDTNTDDATEAALLAKSHLCEIYPQITRKAVEGHGGIGYTWEFGLHVWLKRALFNQAYLGAPQALRAQFADVAGW